MQWINYRNTSDLKKNYNNESKDWHYQYIYLFIYLFIITTKEEWRWDSLKIKK